MTAVVDTNVLISGILSPHGPPGRIIDALFSRAFLVLYDDRILDEYVAVLARPRFAFRPAEVKTLMDFIEAEGRMTPASRLDVVLPDPTDLPFLEVAAAGEADALVTGNARHFTPRKGRHGVTVESPLRFLARLTAV